VWRQFLSGASWGPLGGSCVDLLGVSGASWGPLGGLGGLWGTSWVVFGASWAVLGGSWWPLGGSWWSLWHLLGRLWGVLATLGEISGTTWEFFGTFWGPSGCQKVPQRVPRATQITTETIPERVVTSMAFPLKFKGYFQRVFESCAQAWECVKCIKTHSFHRV